jgi:hypothetical protein
MNNRNKPLKIRTNLKAGDVYMHNPKGSNERLN